MLTQYHDVHGFLHHQPAKTPKQSENGPLFTSTEVVLKAYTGKLTEHDARAYIASLLMLHDLPLKGTWNKIQKFLGWNWSVTPISDRYDFSKDNWYGVIAALLVIKKHYPEIYMVYAKFFGLRIPLIHKQMLHPVSFLIALKFKTNIRLFDFIIKKAFYISARETHKTRGGRKIAKTDGKIMGLILFIAFDFDLGKLDVLVNNSDRDLPLPINNKSVLKFKIGDKIMWQWRSWRDVFIDYFPYQDHPLVVLAGKLG